MGVDRNIKIRLATDCSYFSIILIALTLSIYSFNKDGTITSLTEDDVDDYEYKQFESFNVVKQILDKREEKGLANYIVLLDSDIDDSFLVSSRKLDSSYLDYKNQYELNFSIGHGVRIKGAERYTDFSAYINKLIPLLSSKVGYICEISCTDFDC